MAITFLSGINVDGSIGVNTTSPSEKLKVFEEFVFDNNSKTLTFLDFNISGSTAATGDKTQVGLKVNLDDTTTGGDASNEVRLQGIISTVTSSGSADDIVGIATSVTKTGTDSVAIVRGIESLATTNQTGGNVAQMSGGYFTALAKGDSATVGSMYSVFGLAQTPTDSYKVVSSLFGASFKIEAATSSNGGGATTMTGVFSEVEKDTNTLNTTNAYVYRGQLDGNGGTFTNTYLLRLDYLITGSTVSNSKYGMYLSGADKNYIGGNFGIDVINPTFKLHVNGDAKIIGDVLISTGKELIIGTQTSAESPFGITIRDDKGNVPVGIVIHNENTGTLGDAQIAFETQGTMDFSMGLDRSDASKFVMSRSDTLGANNVFTIDSTVATFSGSVNVNTSIASIAPSTDANNSLLIDNTNASGSCNIRLRGGDGATRIMYGKNGGTDKLYITPRNADTNHFTLDQVGNATVAGDVTVSGGDITLGGTGRIQGVDTVSANTDAASKIYVDNKFNGGVTQITAGTNVTISPSGGTGNVTINASGGGGGGISGSITAGQVAFGNTTADEIKGENDFVYTNLNGLTIGTGIISGSNSTINMNKGASGQCRLELKSQGTRRFDIKLDGVENSTITAFNTLTIATTQGEANKDIIITPARNLGVGTITPQSKLQVNGGVQIADDNAGLNIAAKAGTLRYREDVNIGTPKASNTFIDMYMRTEDSTYEWVNIVTNNW